MTVRSAPRLNMRLSVEDDAVIRLAAEAAGATVTEFVLSAARIAAERKLAEQRIWRLDAAAWDSFTAILDAEPDAADLAKVAALFARAQATDSSPLT